MCTASTAKRRRTQARNGYRHLPKMTRPRIKRTDAAASAKRLQQLIHRERSMQGRKAAKK